MATSLEKLHRFFLQLSRDNDPNNSCLHFIHRKGISATYDSERRLVIGGASAIDWAHEIAHFVEREDERAVGVDNWGFGLGTWSDVFGCFSIQSSTPWEREVRVWTWQTVVMLHFGFTWEEAMKEVIPAFVVVGDKPTVLYRIAKRTPKQVSFEKIEKAFAERLIQNRLKLRRWSWSHFCLELKRKMKMLEAFHHSSQQRHQQQ
jgi:hypothetical protein